MTLEVFADVQQGSDEWIAARCGLITASEISRIMTTKGRLADNEKSRAHLYELVAQRVSGYVEPTYISDDMLRGREGEVYARALYAEHYARDAPLNEVGFMVRHFSGFRIGYSPDGVVGQDGLIEIKSPRQKRHVQTILDGEMPSEHVLQVQTGLLVSGRAWCDFISYCGGLPLFVTRVWPDAVMHAAILEAVEEAEALMAAMEREFRAVARDMIPTERRVEQEMVI